MTITTERWTTTPLNASFGVAYSGSRLESERDGGWIREQLEANLFLVFRGQFLTHDEQVALAGAIGEPTPAHPVVPGHPDHPEILELDGAKGGKNAQWHTDVTFSTTPPAASVLVADELPACGGDTLWANLRAAYEGLSPAVRAAVDQLDAVHCITPLAYWGVPHDSAMSREDAFELLENARKVPPVLHPVVRIHPSTGQRSLFVNPGFTSHIVGLSSLESDAVLNLLYAHSTKPEFVVRHQWQPGDVVLWDNRATMHYACDDYGDAPRRMRRVTIRGDVPFGVSGSSSMILDDPLLAVR